MHNTNINNSQIKIKGDYNNYRTHILYQDHIGGGIIFSLAVRNENKKQKESDTYVVFETQSAMDAWLAKNFNNLSLVYPSKEGGYRCIQIDGITNQGLLGAIGGEITKEGYETPQKLIKRIKRLFRHTKYGMFNTVKKVRYIDDPKRLWDGQGLININFLKRNGIQAEELDRFSSTVIVNGGYHKDHLLVVDGIKDDVILFSRPAKELKFNSSVNFLQLDPVNSQKVIHMDIQTLTGLWMNKLLSPDEIGALVASGFDKIDKIMVEPISSIENIDDDEESESKIVRLGLHECSMMFPRVVAMRWSSYRLALTKFEKLRFPLEAAIKGYAAPLFEIQNGEPVLLDDTCLNYRRGNLMVPLSMINSFKKFHGGCDWDDAMNILPTKKGGNIVWRSPNTFSELKKYEIKF